MYILKERCCLFPAWETLILIGMDVLPEMVIAWVTVPGMFAASFYLKKKAGYFPEHLLGFLSPENLLDLAAEVSVVLACWSFCGYSLFLIEVWFTTEAFQIVINKHRNW